MNVIYAGYDCEVDVWYTPEGFFLGHNRPKYKVDFCFFINKNLWVHCKNSEAMVYLRDEKINSFYHSEGISYSSKGFLITAPGLEICNKSVAMMPELAPGWNIKEAYALCTDFIYG